MSLEHVALLAGLFVVPALLLAVAHRLRRRSPRLRRIFWGALTGHSLAILVMLGVSMFPPILWEGGLRMRDVAVHWSLLLGGVLGGLIAAALRRKL